ncbi:MAG TPA: hypothetical protein ENK21_05740 [Trueperaceae bacterium]|nr:hypothetical protein [Trueperaceae bacterium]
MSSKFKLITSNSVERFEERMADFLALLEPDDIIADIEFSTVALPNSVEYSALIHYTRTEKWA